MASVNGWEIFAHPLLIDQFEKLIEAVERARAKDPDGYQKTASAKTLNAVEKLIWEVVPQDPARAEYRQGSTLGEGRKHWFRAKFGARRFRLFFRYRLDAKLIVFAWVNDENSLRTYGSETDAYAVFRAMLENGNPPDDWEALLAAAKDDRAVERFEALAPQADR